MSKIHVLAVVLAAALVLLPATAVGGDGQAQAEEYVVLYAANTAPAAARQAIEAAGGRVVKENTDVGLATVTSTNASFITDVSLAAAVEGAARNVPVGRQTPASELKPDPAELKAAEKDTAKASEKKTKLKKGEEPLAALQWDMAMIHATSLGSYKKHRGDDGVLVGIIDTGVDGNHPDIAPNFDSELSRNFTTDIPAVDGACEHPTCVDPADEDDNGHGTHVAGIVGAAINGLGIAGVAPDVTIVNLRAGQDSGYFFLQPSVDALTYAANNGVDVVNMSYYIDPWLFNCAANPADSPEAQLEQRTIVAATNRALHYAHLHGVTLIGSEGNEHTDLGNPSVDNTSPDYPPGSEYHRTVDNGCVVVPTEGEHVISIGAVGPSTIKADYSNWGLEQTAVTAPGGYFRDYAGTPQNRQFTNVVLSSYPESVARANGWINPDGTPNVPDVVLDCQEGTCAYYRYLQGTSMASPHAVGVAALIVSEYGDHVGGGGRGMAPDEVESVLTSTATDHACPDPPLIDYTIPGRDRPAEFNAACLGTTEFNSIWGEGIVDALAAVSQKLKNKQK